MKRDFTSASKEQRESENFHGVRAKTKQTRFGFTIIELLVVVAIIGILASIVLASLNNARLKARDARRVADIKQLQLALALYFDSNSAYPAVITGNTLAPTYISTVPTDPLSHANYVYVSLGTGATCTSYHLGAILEDNGSQSLNSDSDAAAASPTCTGSSPSTDFTGTSAACTSSAGTDACFDVTP